MTIEMDVWQVGTLVAGALLSALILAVAHWFPFVRKLNRIAAYVCGVAALYVGFLAWRLLNGDWITPAGLLVIILAGGATVLGAYKIDAIVVRMRQLSKMEALARDDRFSK